MYLHYCRFFFTFSWPTMQDVFHSVPLDGSTNLNLAGRCITAFSSPASSHRRIVNSTTRDSSHSPLRHLVGHYYTTRDIFLHTRDCRPHAACGKWAHNQGGNECDWHASSNWAAAVSHVPVLSQSPSGINKPSACAVESRLSSRLERQDGPNRPEVLILVIHNKIFSSCTEHLECLVGR